VHVAAINLINQQKTFGGLTLRVGQVSSVWLVFSYIFRVGGFCQLRWPLSASLTHQCHSCVQKLKSYRLLWLTVLGLSLLLVFFYVYAC